MTRTETLAIRSLFTFMSSDKFLVRRKLAFVATVQRKLAGRRYDAQLAPLLWLHWVDQAIRRYARVHPRSRACFTEGLRQHLAERLAQEEHERIVHGVYPDLTQEGEMHGEQARVRRWG